MYIQQSPVKLLLFKYHILRHPSPLYPFKFVSLFFYLLIYRAILYASFTTENLKWFRCVNEMTDESNKSFHAKKIRKGRGRSKLGIT